MLFVIVALYKTPSKGTLMILAPIGMVFVPRGVSSVLQAAVQSSRFLNPGTVSPKPLTLPLPWVSSVSVP